MKFYENCSLYMVEFYLYIYILRKNLQIAVALFFCIVGSGLTCEWPRSGLRGRWHMGRWLPASNRVIGKRWGRHRTMTPTLRADGETSVSATNDLKIANNHQNVNSHGFAPSATISMRIEDRLVSFCSLWAIMAQWRSRHLTKATRADSIQDRLQYYNYNINDGRVERRLKQRCDCTFVNMNPLHPGHGTRFHDSVGDCDGVNSVHYTLEEDKNICIYI